MNYICPFMSTPNEKQLCISNCSLRLRDGCAINLTAKHTAHIADSMDLMQKNHMYEFTDISSKLDDLIGILSQKQHS